jgi:2-methylfumaryl-CoA hydratase
VLAGDTIYAASRVLEKKEYSAEAGTIRFKLVGVKNETPGSLIGRGVDLFESGFDQKVFEIERSILMPKSASLPPRSTR